MIRAYVSRRNLSVNAKSWSITQSPIQKDETACATDNTNRSLQQVRDATSDRQGIHMFSRYYVR